MIAERCGVSAAVVSACLSDRKTKIRFSAAKAEEIRKTAAEMNYTPSVFARSTRTGEVPIVGAMFYAGGETWQLHQRYFQNTLMDLTFRFNAEGFEVTFIPYHSQAEQIERLRKVISCGMVGGVVSNIMPYSHTDFCHYLKECNLPYMVMGNPSIEGVFSVHYASTATHIMRKLYQESGLKHCFRVFVSNGEALFSPGIPDDYSLFDKQPLTLDEVKKIAGKSYFIIPGHEILNYIRSKGFFPPNILLYEQASEYLMPSKEYDLLVFDVKPSRNSYITSALSRWLKEGVKPETICHAVSDNTAFEFFPKLTE